MNKTSNTSTRVIQIKDGIIGPVEPSLKTLKPKKIGDYPEVPKVYLEVARNLSSPLQLNPPICDELIALVQHMYTEEEASFVRHIKPLRKKSAAEIARLENRPVEEVREILEFLANDKHVLASFGLDNNKNYMIMPLAPGTFEGVQMGQIVGTVNDKLDSWRKRFAELFEELYMTGYYAEYAEYKTYFLRFLPVEKSVESSAFALPSDRVEEVFDRYNKFAVGNCGCRMSLRQTGKDCGHLMEVCTAMGDYSEYLVNRGLMRNVGKKEIIDIKRQAEADGMVHWVGNYDELSGKYGSFSCSCCKCCCVALRTINQFNMPGPIVPAHFTPLFDQNKCDFCGLCAKRCPVAAITVDTKNKTLAHQPVRCIGCGQCSLACEKKHAIKMKAVKKYKKPASSLPMMSIKLLPRIFRMTLGIWNKRR